MLTLATTPDATGWEIAAAVGTIAGAAATLIAVGAALWIGGRDRRASERAVQEQIAANDAAVRLQIEAASKERRREEQVKLLVRLLTELGRYAGMRSQDAETKEVRRTARGLFQALVDTSGMPTTHLFVHEIRLTMEQAREVLERHGSRPDMPLSSQIMASFAQSEVAEKLKQLTS